ncbi:unnamed protein product [Moneuplotes crassus]|uniref:Uncharacterized protein n=1 Tax=Euplotes crassus TaxID=5936 RepID=A0AAD1U5Y9_EUPCR|nr:unnamed protein product [Moneuplotes crassus]
MNKVSKENSPKPKSRAKNKSQFYEWKKSKLDSPYTSYYRGIYKLKEGQNKVDQFMLNIKAAQAESKKKKLTVTQTMEKQQKDLIKRFKKIQLEENKEEIEQVRDIRGKARIETDLKKNYNKISDDKGILLNKLIYSKDPNMNVVVDQITKSKLKQSIEDNIKDGLELAKMISLVDQNKLPPTQASEPSEKKLTTLVKVMSKVKNKSKLNYKNIINIDYDSMSSPYRPISGPGPLTTRGSLTHRLGRVDILKDNVLEILTPKDALPIGVFNQENKDIAREFNCRTANASKNHKFSFEFEINPQPPTPANEKDGNSSLMTNSRIKHILKERAKTERGRIRHCESLKDCKQEKILISHHEEATSTPKRVNWQGKQVSKRSSSQFKLDSLIGHALRDSDTRVNRICERQARMEIKRENESKGIHLHKAFIKSKKQKLNRLRTENASVPTIFNKMSKSSFKNGKLDNLNFIITKQYNAIKRVQTTFRSSRRSPSLQNPKTSKRMFKKHNLILF